MRLFSDNGTVIGSRAVLFAACIAIATFYGPAQAQKYEEGVHYHTLSAAQPVQTGDNIEVLELFWYHCPHCFALEPVLDSWLEQGKPANAESQGIVVHPIGSSGSKGSMNDTPPW